MVTINTFLEPSSGTALENPPSSSSEDFWGPNRSLTEDAGEKHLLDTGDLMDEEFFSREDEGITPSLEEIMIEAHASRERRLNALLLRPETLELLELMSQSETEVKCALGTTIFQSQAHLHTFADLVNEDLIALANDKVIMTELCQRLLKTLADI